MAKAMHPGGKHQEMQAHKARALMIFASNPSMGADQKIQDLKSELEALPE